MKRFLSASLAVFLSLCCVFPAYAAVPDGDLDLQFIDCGFSSSSSVKASNFHSLTPVDGVYSDGVSSSGYSAYYISFDPNPFPFDSGLSGRYFVFSGSSHFNDVKYSFTLTSYSDAYSFSEIVQKPNGSSSTDSYYYSCEFGSSVPTGSYIIFLYVPVSSASYIGDSFALSDAPYTPPGFEDEDGWLGSLIKAIIEGIQMIIDGITNLPENIANAVKGFFDMVVNAIVQLGQTILDGLKSLFIPSDGYFEGVASDMQAWLEDHLGLLVYPFTLVADLASRIAAVEGGEPTAHIPEIAYTDDGDKYVLIAEQEVNLYDQVGRNETFIELHQLYLMAMDAAIGGALAFLAWKKFDQITGGSST